jgi:hypothetical protein
MTAEGLEVFGGLNQKGPSRNCWRLDASLARWQRTPRTRNAVMSNPLDFSSGTGGLPPDYERISKIASTSTAAPVGSDVNPRALRA